LWKSINSLKKKVLLLCMKSQDLLRGINLTCNSFTSAVHIVREVRLKDCSTQIRHTMHDSENYPFSECILTIFVF